MGSLVDYAPGINPKQNLDVWVVVQMSIVITAPFINVVQPNTNLKPAQIVNELGSHIVNSGHYD